MPKPLKVLLILGGLLAVAVALAVWLLWRAMLGDLSAPSAELESERMAAKREGLPLETADVFKHRPVAEGKNAGPVVAKECEEIRLRMPSTSAEYKALAAISKGQDDYSQKVAVAQFIGAQNKRLDRLAAASKLEICDFGHDYSQGYKVLFPEFAGIKAVVRVFSAKGVLAAEKGRIAESEEAFSTALRLSSFAAQEPCLIGSLVQIACNVIAHRHIRQLLKERGGDERVLAMTERVLAEAPARADLRSSFAGEVVMGVATLRSLTSLREIEMLSGGGTSEGRPFDTVNATMRRAWEARFIQFWRRIYGRISKGEDSLLEVAAVLREEERKESSHKSLSYLMNAIMVPVFDEAGMSAVRDHAEYALTSAMAKLIRYRKARGSFPERLEQTGKTYLDPFDGKPLRYVKGGSGFLLYSIDKDLRDDGGAKPQPGGDSKAPRDLVVEFP